MTEVLMTCTRCDGEIAVRMDQAILRMDIEPRADAELLYCCPSCGAPSVRRVVGELLTLLLFVGVEPLRLSEPTLPRADQPPAVSPLTRDDLLTWHEVLHDIENVTPWQP
ncbi:hypothetical protein [Nocardioides halotolerans]|uniref:hypothetical protein n=1 Tax=Nocardioides halotolerans TaxID=433660 RepID=UPI0004920E51|nr:hypothetical protein [Nocardioides halotolerans]